MDTRASFTSTGASKNEMAGSMHQYTNGYGYGIRVPTARNMPTLPASVPKMRYPPESARFLETSTCTVLVKTDSRAQQRLKDQGAFQTSGEYGRWYTEPNSDMVKLGFGKIPQQEFRRPPKPAVEYASTESNHQFHSARLGTPMNIRYNKDATYSTTSLRKDNFDATNGTASSREFNDQWSASRSSNQISGGSSANRSLYYETLKSLDKQHSRQSRKDLFAATLPTKSTEEQIHVVTAAHTASQQGKVWSHKLRA